MVSFKDGKGEWLPAGSEVWVNGGETSFTIGYDGETYLTGLAATNNVLIKDPKDAAVHRFFRLHAQPQRSGPNPRRGLHSGGTTEVAEQTGGETRATKR